MGNAKMKYFFSLVVSILMLVGRIQGQTLGKGMEPEIAVGSDRIIRIIYGFEDTIFYLYSTNGGKEFSKPATVATISGMHLGMERGPQLATSKDVSMVTATDKKGTIHSFKLDHKTGEWRKVTDVNDVPEIAKEGLMDLAADDNNNFYAAWLDLRIENKNNIAFAKWSIKNDWDKNRIIYISPEKTVCECCRPSIAVNGKHISVMFRNNVAGNRDLYVTSSENGGRNFKEAIKLGEGSWKLAACPMDGGALVIGNQGEIKTIWQRDRQIFYAEPGMPESKIGNGRSPKIAASKSVTLLSWNEDGKIRIKQAGKDAIMERYGIGFKPLFVESNVIAAAWEQDKQILFERIVLK
jgi:hypothetical protein